MRRFEPGRLQVFSPDASWVLLWPRDGAWPDAPFVLEIEGAGLQTLELHGPAPGSIRTAQTTRGDQAWPAHGRLAFAISQAPEDGEPLRLQVVSDNASILIAFVDPDFVFRFANRAHVAWFHRPMEQIIGEPMERLVGAG